ncbi:coiled-coil domain containing 92Bb [Brachyhypopomus gauderio]|uniref:coiled-coil domain containing 92Bb n=1 Tax=Brachyhypopomus gauderio TaxID=698409 RepID=UPI0040414DD8
MDTGPLALQVESVERNIAFLQKEHQLLLTGLRVEIRHLKKRCNDLSCELSKRPPGRSSEDIEAEEEQLRARLLESEQRLAEQECTQAERRAELRLKGAQASGLQTRLRDEERRCLAELKRRGHKITALSRDLRRQTDVAAQLAFKLHSTRFRLYHQAEPAEEEEEEEEEGEDQHHHHHHHNNNNGGDMQGPSCAAGFHQTPAVRAESRHHGHSSLRTRRSERARECVPQERVLGPEEPHPMPDPALFLYPFRHRLLPLHMSLGGHWREGNLPERSDRQLGRLRTRSLREDTGPETTEL